MKTKLTTFMMAFAIFFTSNFFAPKSEALIGLLVKKKVVKVIGGIGLAAGGVGVVSGVATISTATTLSSALGGVIFIYLGAIAGGIGLVILDDNTVVDMEFNQVTKELAPDFSEYDIAIYNSELEELNAIRKTIQAEVGENDTMEKAKDLWLDYSQVLSPETVAIAQDQVLKFSKNVKR